jgi:HK97 family phage prohead protease
MKKSTKTFILSDETPNILGWSLSTAGLDIQDFAANPVMLYNHDYTKLIGQWTDVRKEGEKLLGVPMFDENDPEAMKYYDKAEQGILKAASVGITPVEFDELNAVMRKSNLKEASLTPVGANRKAITVYDSEGKKLSADAVKGYCLSLQQEQKQTQITEMDKKLLAALIALSAQAGLTITLSADSEQPAALDAIDQIGKKIISLSAEKQKVETRLKQIEDDAKAEEEKNHTAALKKAVEDKVLTAEQAAAPEFKGLPLPTLAVVLSAMKPASVQTIATETKKETSGDGKDDKSNWSYDDYAEKAPMELSAMSEKEPAKFEALLSAKTKSVREKHSIEL